MKKKLSNKIAHCWQEYDQLVGGCIFHEKKQACRKKEPNENKLPLFLLVDRGSTKKGTNKIPGKAKYQWEYTWGEPTEIGLVIVVGISEDNRPNL